MKNNLNNDNNKDKIKREILKKEFGASYFLQDISKDILVELKEIYPNDWQSLFAFCVNKLVYRASLTEGIGLLEESFLSETMKDAFLFEMSNLLTEVGGNKEENLKFMKKFAKGSKHIFFKLKDSLPNLWYFEHEQVRDNNNNKKFDEDDFEDTDIPYSPYGDLFYMFSTDSKMPIYYENNFRMMHEIEEFNNFIDETQLSDCVLVIDDKSFYSEQNMFLLKKTKLKYILELERNALNIDYVKLDKKMFDGFFFHYGQPLMYYCIEEKEGVRLIAFKSSLVALEDSREFINRLESEDKYDGKEYYKISTQFGMTIIMTNCPKEITEKEIYLRYISKIEEERRIYNIFKSFFELDRVFIESREEMAGWLFLSHLSIMIYYRVFNLLKEKNAFQTISVDYLLDQLSRIEKIKIDDEFVVSKIPYSTKKLMEYLGIKIPVD